MLISRFSFLNRYTLYSLLIFMLHASYLHMNCFLRISKFKIFSCWLFSPNATVAIFLVLFFLLLLFCLYLSVFSLSPKRFCIFLNLQISSCLQKINRLEERASQLFDSKCNAIFIVVFYYFCVFVASFWLHFSQLVK